ncbi:hypothetical protein Tco_0167689 [Tanacetum coccineum]
MKNSHLRYDWLNDQRITVFFAEFSFFRSSAEPLMKTQYHTSSLKLVFLELFIKTLRLFLLPQLWFWFGKSLGGMVHSVSSISETFPSSCFEMSSVYFSKCSDSGSDMCIDESTPASLVSVICHPVEERVGCCLEADASDSLGFFELWSSAFGGGLADPEAADKIYPLSIGTWDLIEAKTISKIDQSSLIQTSLALFLPLLTEDDGMRSNQLEELRLTWPDDLIRLWRDIHHHAAQGLVHQETHVIFQSLIQYGVLSWAPGSGQQSLMLAFSGTDTRNAYSDVTVDAGMSYLFFSSLRPFPFPLLHGPFWELLLDTGSTDSLLSNSLRLEGFFVGGGAGLVCLTGVVVVGFLGVAHCVADCQGTLLRSEAWKKLLLLRMSNVESKESLDRVSRCTSRFSLPVHLNRQDNTVESALYSGSNGISAEYQTNFDNLS